MRCTGCCAGRGHNLCMILRHLGVLLSDFHGLAHAGLGKQAHAGRVIGTCRELLRADYLRRTRQTEVVRGERWFGEAITLLHCDRRTGIELRYFAFP
ncbi:hypothetical protein D3C85_799670 [compost metagenome]